MHRRIVTCCLVALAIPSLSYAYCEEVRTDGGGYADGYYLRGYKRLDQEGNCIDPYEIVKIRVNVAGSDVGLQGMMYIGASSDNVGSAIMTPGGDWEPDEGGMHPPTAQFGSLPGSYTFTILDSSGGFDPDNPLMQPPLTNAAVATGPATMCELIQSYGVREAKIGGGYGAVQPREQETIRYLRHDKNAPTDLTHILWALAYADGAVGEKYGVALKFNCECGEMPSPDCSGGGN